VLEDSFKGEDKNRVRPDLRLSGIGQRPDEIGEQIDPDARPWID
jgi:hypothetical protein